MTDDEARRKAFDKLAREQRLRRRLGPVEEAKENVKVFNEKQADWRTVCPKCKTALEGTLTELREHNCSG